MTHFVRAVIVVAPAAAVVIGYVVSDKKPGPPSAPWDAKDWLPHSGASHQSPLDIWLTPTPPPPWDSHHGIVGGRLYNPEGGPRGVPPERTPATPNSEDWMTGVKL